MKRDEIQLRLSSPPTFQIIAESPGWLRRERPVRWDGNRVLFEIADGQARVACAISKGALEDISDDQPLGGPAFVRCFVAARPRIEAVARGKISGGTSRPGTNATLNIWASDLGDLPPSGTPARASRLRA